MLLLIYKSVQSVESGGPGWIEVRVRVRVRVRVKVRVRVGVKVRVRVRVGVRVRVRVRVRFEVPVGRTPCASHHRSGARGRSAGPG